jgi:L-rhamnose mutarotase
MRVLNGLRKQYNLSREMEEYIKRYEIIYKIVIKEAKRKGNDKYVFRANNKTKVLWHVINTEVGKSWKYGEKIELNSGTEVMSNPQNVVGMLNTFFIEIIDDL